MTSQIYGLFVRTMGQDLPSGLPQAERPSPLSALLNALPTPVIAACASLFLALMLANGVVSGITQTGVIGVA